MGSAQDSALSSCYFSFFPQTTLFITVPSHSVGSDSVTPWTVACQVPLSRRLFWQEYWNGLPFPPPEDLPGPGIESESLRLLHWQVDSLPPRHLGSPYALLQLLSHFSRVRLCAAPSLGFSRQEHWSGLPFPSPMHKSESEVAQPCPTLRDPMDCSLPDFSVHGIFQARVLEWDAIAFSTMPY